MTAVAVGRRARAVHRAAGRPGHRPHAGPRARHPGATACARLDVAGRRRRRHEGAVARAVPGRDGRPAQGGLLGGVRRTAPAGSPDPQVVDAGRRGRAATARPWSGAGALLYPDAVPARAGPEHAGRRRCWPPRGGRPTGAARAARPGAALPAPPGRRADRRAPASRSRDAAPATAGGRRGRGRAGAPSCSPPTPGPRPARWSRAGRARRRRSYVVAEHGRCGRRLRGDRPAPARSPTCSGSPSRPTAQGRGWRRGCWRPVVDARDSGADTSCSRCAADNAAAQRALRGQGFTEIDAAPALLPRRVRDAVVMRACDAEGP